jgi:hypothetical protein
MDVGWARGGRALVAALAVVSSAGSAEAYTVKQTESGATVRWHANAVTLRIDASMQAYFRDIPVRKVVQQAAQAWAGLPNAPELLVNVGEPGPNGFDQRANASNGIYLVKDWKLAESALAVTVATFETKSGKIVDTDILVNPNHPFALLGAGPDAPADDFDLHGVLTHEMGHVLGLGESFDVRAATMWPNVARGETHQRDLDQDDEEGVATAYGQAVAAEITSSSAPGCVGASVVVRRGRGLSPLLWIALGVGLLGTGLWMRSRARHGKGRGAPMFALVLLFGAPLSGGDPRPTDASTERVEVLRTLALRHAAPAVRAQGLTTAAGSESPPVRIAAAAVLERSGAREDLSLASRLALDEEPEVRRMGVLAYERVRTAPPAARLKAESVEARARLKSLIGGADEVIEGEAVRAGVHVQDGLVWSRYLVHGRERVVEVQIAGGSLGEITQVVSEQEAPDDGSTLVVAQRRAGRFAWAHLRDGVVYGGFLGDGPGIEWTGH